jgi:hypothetical protein
LSEVTRIDVDGVYALGVGHGGGPGVGYLVCLIGVQAVPVQDAIAEAELTELFEVFSSINEAWEGLDVMKGRGLRSS